MKKDILDLLAEAGGMLYDVSLGLFSVSNGGEDVSLRQYRSVSTVYRRAFVALV